MVFNSRTVQGQREPIHPNLQATVLKHASTPFQQPIQPYSVQSIKALAQEWHARGNLPLVLDSGCGTGYSTEKLAQQHNNALVVGIDQSEHRLGKDATRLKAIDDTQNTLFQHQTLDNCLLLRGNVIDCWRLLLSQNIRPSYHYLLYPNPWPKKKHLQRRWHGHPVLPTLLDLGGQLELRSNWKTYVDEFCAALHLSDFVETSSGVFKPSVFLTPFEKKYALSEQTLYRLTCDLKQNTG